MADTIRVNLNRIIKTIELEYPRSEGNVNAIEIELMSVRAANSILVEFDFDRNGWKVSMATKNSWTEEEAAGGCDPGYEEVAFINAWEKGDVDE